MLQIMWFNTNPLPAIGIGESKKRQKGGAAASNQTRWIFTNPNTGSQQHPNRLSKQFGSIIRHLVPHDVIGRLGQLVCQRLCRQRRVAL